MAQIHVRKLEEETKAKLRERAKRHGRSIEEEVREILRNAVQNEDPLRRKLGTETRELFAKAGLKRGEIKELRGIRLQIPDFSK